jgi:quercetin dioxygenase-like cupin family protein
MEVKKLIFPEPVDGYLKNIFQKQEEGVAIQCGSVVLGKGAELPSKTMEFHEISYLISGKLKVSTKEGGEKIMNVGDLIYLTKEELRKTITLEESKILFFLFKKLSS